jgi:hypothetical protein
MTSTTIIHDTAMGTLRLCEVHVIADAALDLEENPSLPVI